MAWPPLSYLSSRVPLPERYTLDHLHASEVSDLVRELPTWFPQIKVGGERCHFTEEFYRGAQLKGDTEDRRIFPVVIKHGGKIVSLTTLDKDDTDRTISARMGGVHPAHRGAGIGKLGPIFVETMGRGCGAQLAYYFVTLRIPLEQVISEKAGYQLVGILPASDFETMEDGTVKRVPEALYAKVLADENTVYTPPPETLTENTRRVWKFLFGN